MNSDDIEDSASARVFVRESVGNARCFLEECEFRPEDWKELSQKLGDVLNKLDDIKRELAEAAESA